MDRWYQQLHQSSLDDEREVFWLEAARQLDWIRAPQRAFDPEAGVYGRWFPDGICNTCDNCVDRHVRGGRGEQTAIIYVSPLDDTEYEISYATLLEEVAALAAVLVDLGVGKGDRVLIYMPMVPQALFAMLACARLGAPHSVVFGGFGARELANRIDDAEPKVILSASCGLEPSRVVAYKPLLDAALELAKHKPEACLVLARRQLEASLVAGRDFDWAQKVEARRGSMIGCTPLSALDPLYILYTSGTTGHPKGVVRDNGGHMVALTWSMKAIYNTGPGDIFWAASDLGWVVGHSYIAYAPLLVGATTVLYEGKPVGTPDAAAFPRVIARHRVSTLFTAPTALRAIRREDPEGRIWNTHAPGLLRNLFLAGERADIGTLSWCRSYLGIDPIDHWWQTETGWPISANPAGFRKLPIRHGAAGVPMPGYDIAILDAEGRALAPGDIGTIAIKLPLPPGALPTLWRDDDRMRRDYLSAFPGYYDTRDRGFLDEDGYLQILGRTDDVINVAGHRFSTGSFEDLITMAPEVIECAVIGVPDALKGEVPVGFIVLRQGIDPSPDIEAGVMALIRKNFGPVASFRSIVTVPRLPKTRSGKIIRALIRGIMADEPWTLPPTIEDPSVVQDLLEIRARMHVV